MTAIEKLLKPESLTPKKVNGREVNGEEFLKYSLKCFELFGSDELPTAGAIYEATKEL